MVLYSEQVRNLVNEKNLFKDTGTYTQTSTGDYVTKVSKTITLDISAKVVVRFTFQLKNITGSPVTIGGNARVKIDGIPAVAYGYQVESVPANDTKTYERDVIVYLTYGNHTFDFELCLKTGSYVQITNLNIGIIAFIDTNLDSLYQNVSVPNATTITVATKTFKVPPTRKLALGSIKKIAVVAMVYAGCEGYAGSKMKNVGEADEALLNWKIYLDGTQKDWTNRKNDPADGTVIGEGAHGRFSVAVDPDTQHMISVEVYNNSGASRDVTVYLNIIQSPWICPDPIDFEPITLTFAQGSTLYVIAEPLGSDVTKSVKIGKKRAASLGDTTDFYSVQTGTGIIIFSYTFEVVEVAKCVLVVEGAGTCISIIGADIRSWA